MTHAPDDETPIAETLEALAAFIEQGLVGSVGACNVTDAQLRLALDTSERLGLPAIRVDSERVQPAGPSRRTDGHPAMCGTWPRLHARIARSAENPFEEVPTGRRRAAGLTSGCARRAAPGVHGRPHSGGVQRFASEAVRRGVSTSGLALAWVMSRGNVTAPVVGPRRLEHLGAIRERWMCGSMPMSRARLASLISA